MVNFARLNVKYSLLHFLTLIFFTTSLCILLATSNCVILFKLIVGFIIVFLANYLIYYISKHSNQTTVEFLFDINSVIINKAQQIEIYEIKNWFNLGSWCVFIQLFNKNTAFSIIIPKHSCDLVQYKNLLRNVIWNQPKQT